MTMDTLMTYLLAYQLSYAFCFFWIRWIFLCIMFLRFSVKTYDTQVVAVCQQHTFLLVNNTVKLLIDHMSTTFSVMFSILTMSHHRSVTSQRILSLSWCIALFHLSDAQGIFPETVPTLGWLTRYTQHTCEMYVCYHWVTCERIRGIAEKVVEFLLMLHHDVCIYLCHIENLKKEKMLKVSLPNDSHCVHLVAVIMIACSI